MKTNTILVDKDTYFFLNDESRRQRGCSPLDEKQKDKMWKRMYKYKEKKLIDNDTLGGGDGTYNGHWWSWSLETIKDMLNEAGLEYENGPEIEYSYL